MEKPKYLPRTERPSLSVRPQNTDAMSSFDASILRKAQLVRCVLHVTGKSLLKQLILPPRAEFGIQFSSVSEYGRINRLLWFSSPSYDT